MSKSAADTGFAAAASAPVDALRRGFDVLAAGLEPFVSARCREVHGEDWSRKVALAEPELNAFDPKRAPYLLRVLVSQWHEVFETRLGAGLRGRIAELRTVEQQLDRGEEPGTRRAAQALGSMEDLLRAAAAPSAAGIVETIREELVAAPEVAPRPPATETGPESGGGGPPAEPPDRARRFDGWSALAALGRVLVTAGLLILLFVAYQLWGTGLYTDRAQRDLRRDFTAQREAFEREQSTTTTAPDEEGPPPSAPVTIPPPPAEGEGLALLSIPSANVDDVVVVQGTARSDLAMGPGHYDGTPLPGENGNVAIAGHRTTYGAPFYDLDAVKLGDRIVIETFWGRYTYEVSGFCRDATNPDAWNFSELNCDPNLPREPWIAVKPSQTEVVPSLLDPEFEPILPVGPDNLPYRNTLTLTTCNPRYSAAQRLVVRAELVPNEASPPIAAVDERDAQRPISVSAGDVGALEDAWPSFWWGLLAAGAGAAWFAIYRLRRRIRTPSRVRRTAAALGLWLAGAVPFFVVLFFFYVHLERLLPSSY